MYYFEWQSDLHVPCMARFMAEQQKAYELQNRYTDNPFLAWEEQWKTCESARRAIADLLHVRRQESVVLTQGTMEGLTRVLSALALDRNRVLTTRDTVVVSDCEFPPLYHLLCPNFDIEVVKVSGCSKQEIVDRFAAKFAGQTFPPKALIISHVLYRNGAILPVRAIVDSVRRIRPDTVIIIDGAQTIGNVEVDVEAVGADFYVADFHKWVQGPNFTGFVYCSTQQWLELLTRHATHPMAFSRSMSIENHLCSKFGPLPFAFAALPAALQGFIVGDLVVHSFELADRLRELVISSKAFKMSLGLLSPEDGRSAVITLPLRRKQRGLRRHLFEKDRILVSEHWPQIPEVLDMEIESPGFLRMGVSDNWNTPEDVEFLFQHLEAAWNT